MSESQSLNRRSLLQGAAACAATTAVLSSPLASTQQAEAREPQRPGVNKGRIKQSIMGWCFKPMPVEELAKHCADLGMAAMEGIPAKHYPMIKKLGLKVSLRNWTSGEFWKSEGSVSWRCWFIYGQ